MNLRLEENRTDLVKQLLYFDEEFSEELSRASFGAAEKHTLKTLADQYCAALNHLLSQGEHGPDCSDKVLIGSSVKIRYEDGGDEESYTLVLPNSSNVDDGNISILSPLGMKLLLRQTGEQIGVSSPAGEYKVEIVSIA